MRYHEGYDIVYAQRISRAGDGLMEKLTAFTFYRLIQDATEVRIPGGTGDYGLLSCRAIEARKWLRDNIVS